jgi:Fic family protein
MTIREQLALLQQISGLNQEALALRLGVTVTAYNRWFNEKSIPRPAAQAKIADTLAHYVGADSSATQSIPQGATTRVQAKCAYIAQQKKLHGSPLATILSQPDLRDQFALSLTFHTNSIEGSTFSEADTSVVLFENATVPNKTLVEHLEARNHLTALLFLFDHLAADGEITEVFVLKLHALLMNSIRPDAGAYRAHAVRIVGAHVPTTNYLRVPEKMRECIVEMKAHTNTTQHSGVAVLAEALALTHAQFEQIHPFSDGNGRVGRLLLCALALRAGYPPPIVRKEKRSVYMRALNRAQLQSEHEPLAEFMLDCLIEGYAVLERR